MSAIWALVIKIFVIEIHGIRIIQFDIKIVRSRVAESLV